MAILLLFAFFALLSICWPFRMIGQSMPLLILAPGMIVLCVFATCNVVYSTKGNRPSQWWLAVLLPSAVLVAAGHYNWAVRASGFQMFKIPSRSMEKTVMQGSHVMVDRWYYRGHGPADGDLIIYINRERLFVIKRLIAQGGETIESHDGKVSVNGRSLTEPYVVRDGPADWRMDNFGPIKIPPGKLFFMGDNRNNSYDSRMPEVGPIDADSVYGKPLYTIPSLGNGGFKIIR
jgi:signal peptidase I